MQSRDFIYVDDVIEVLHWSLRNVKRGIYNLGSGAANPFLELALSAFEALKVFPKIEWVDTPEDIRDQYQYFTKAEMQKLRTAGYKKPFTNLKSGIKAYAKRLDL
jgi:ADP-L-glycero-D-manno-heptose 6-epimerase